MSDEVAVDESERRKALISSRIWVAAMRSVRQEPACEILQRPPKVPCLAWLISAPAHTRLRPGGVGPRARSRGPFLFVLCRVPDWRNSALIFNASASVLAPNVMRFAHFCCCPDWETAHALIAVPSRTTPVPCSDKGNPDWITIPYFSRSPHPHVLASMQPLRHDYHARRCCERTPRCIRVRSHRAGL